MAVATRATIGAFCRRTSDAHVAARRERPVGSMPECCVERNWLSRKRLMPKTKKARTASQMRGFTRRSRSHAATGSIVEIVTIRPPLALILEDDSGGGLGDGDQGWPSREFVTGPSVRYGSGFGDLLPRFPWPKTLIPVASKSIRPR